MSTISLRKLLFWTVLKGPLGVIKITLITLVLGGRIFGNYTYVLSLASLASIIFLFREEIIIHKHASSSLPRIVSGILLLQSIAFLATVGVTIGLLMLGRAKLHLIVAVMCVALSQILESYTKSVSDRFGKTILYEKKRLLINALFPVALVGAFGFILKGTSLRSSNDIFISYLLIAVEFVILAISNLLFLLSHHRVFVIKTFSSFKSISYQLFSAPNSLLTNLVNFWQKYKTIYLINYPSAIFSSFYGVSTVLWIKNLYGLEILGAYNLVQTSILFLPMLIATNINRKLFIEGSRLYRENKFLLLNEAYNYAILRGLQLIIPIYLAFLLLPAAFFSIINHFKIDMVYKLEPYFDRIYIGISAVSLAGIIFILCTCVMSSISKCVSRFTIIGREDYGLLINISRISIPLIISFMAYSLKLEFQNALLLQFVLTFVFFVLQLYLIKFQVNSLAMSQLKS